MLCVLMCSVLMIIDCEHYLHRPRSGLRGIIFTLCVCVCLSVCVSGQYFGILFIGYYRGDIDLKFMQYTYRVVLNHLYKYVKTQIWQPSCLCFTDHLQAKKTYNLLNCLFSDYK